MRLAETRLLTLVGPGGIGKTRLAVKAAEAAASIHADGLAFADLSVLRDATLVVQTVAAALGLEEQSGQTLRNALVEWLRVRHLLLVLDNCEHLIQECAELVEQLLQAVGLSASSELALPERADSYVSVAPNPCSPVGSASRLLHDHL